MPELLTLANFLAIAFGLGLFLIAFLIRGQKKIAALGKTIMIASLLLGIAFMAAGSIELPGKALLAIKFGPLGPPLVAEATPDPGERPEDIYNVEFPTEVDSGKTDDTKQMLMIASFKELEAFCGQQHEESTPSPEELQATFGWVMNFDNWIMDGNGGPSTLAEMFEELRRLAPGSCGEIDRLEAELVSLIVFTHSTERAQQQVAVMQAETEALEEALVWGLWEEHQVKIVTDLEARERTRDPFEGRPLPCTGFTMLHKNGGPEPDGCYAVGCSEGYAVPKSYQGGIWSSCSSYQRLARRAECYIVTDKDGTTHSHAYVDSKWVAKKCS